MRSKFELQIEFSKIRQVPKLKYLGSILKEGGKCDTDIWRRIIIAKYAFPKLGRVIRNKKTLLETRKRVLNSYVMYVLLFGSEWWRITSKTKKKQPKYGSKQERCAYHWLNRWATMKKEKGNECISSGRACWGFYGPYEERRLRKPGKGSTSWRQSVTGVIRS